MGWSLACSQKLTDPEVGQNVQVKEIKNKPFHLFCIIFYKSVLVPGRCFSPGALFAAAWFDRGVVPGTKGQGHRVPRE